MVEMCESRLDSILPTGQCVYDSYVASLTEVILAMTGTTLGKTSGQVTVEQTRR